MYNDILIQTIIHDNFVNFYNNYLKNYTIVYKA